MAKLIALARKGILQEGAEPLPGTPDRQASGIDREEAKWGALVRRRGIRSQ